MRDKISRDDLLERQDTAVGNHYLSLSVTVVGLGLAAAAAALASLIAQFAALGPNRLILILLWLGGLLCIAVAYAGPMVGAFAMARAVPVIRDLAPPLGLGIAEFLVFAIFIRTFNPTTDIGPALLTWYAAIFLFGLCAFLVIARARSLFEGSLASYDADVLEVIKEYLDYLTFSIYGPVMLIVISAIGFAAWVLGHEKSIAIVCLSLIILNLIFGLWFHDVQAKPWQGLLSGNEPAEAPRIIRRQIRRIQERRIRDSTFLPTTPDEPALSPRIQSRSSGGCDVVQPDMETPGITTPEVADIDEA